MAINSAEKLSCVILPLQHTGGILIPASALVEVIDSKNLNVVVDLQSGVLGKMQWKNAAIPIISYEAAAGLVPASFNSETRAVVVRIAIENIRLDYVAITISGIPRYIELSSGQIKAVPDEDNIGNLLSETRVQVDGQLLWVADMNAVAHHIQAQVI